jgi:hypothetical protein
MAEGLIVIGMTGMIVGGVGMLAAAGARESEMENIVNKIVNKTENSYFDYEKYEKDNEIMRQSMREFVERKREIERDRERESERRKNFENQFIDEFPELSLHERKKLSWKIARVEAVW